MSKREQDIEASPHPDGLREGVMNDSKGVGFGIKMDEDQMINPAQIQAYKEIKLKNPYKD